jgi:novobiocin biosynthesis protein NovU/D-mycarose 3-C-methyltransferase
MARGAMPPVNVVVARHVFCHVDDWRAFIRSLDKLCVRDTAVVIEVPHAKDLLEKCEFDTIYHEHLSYFTLRSLQFLLESSPFRIHRIQRFPIHGGSVVVMLRRRDHDSKTVEGTQDQIKHENITQEDWSNFSASATERLRDLRDYIYELKGQGKKMVGFGASAKSSVWVNAARLTRKELAFICDCTPQKWNTTSPGSDIPVVDEGALLRDQPDVAICFAWNFREEILHRQELWRSQGGRFVFPFPKLEMI